MVRMMANISRVIFICSCQWATRKERDQSSVCFI